MSFSFLTKDDAALLLPFLKKKLFHAGSILIDEGQVPSCCWLLVTGRLLVKKQTTYPGRFVTIALLDPGAIVGEQLLAESIGHTTTVTALDDVELLELSSRSWEDFVRAHPEAAVRFLRYVLGISSLRLQGATRRLADLL